MTDEPNKPAVRATAAGERVEGADPYNPPPDADPISWAGNNPTTTPASPSDGEPGLAEGAPAEVRSARRPRVGEHPAPRHNRNYMKEYDA